MEETIEKNEAVVNEQEETEPQKKKKRKHRSPMRYPQLFILHAIIIVIVIWVMFGVFFGFISAPNDDMLPRINAGDLLLYYRLANTPKANDVVVINKNDTNYVVRVVASGGDTVEITDSERLVINGNTVIENKIYASTPRYEGFVEYPLTLKENEYFVLADSRSNAEDSRYFGTVKKDEILGTVITVMRRNNI